MDQSSLIVALVLCIIGVVLAIFFLSQRIIRHRHAHGVACNAPAIIVYFACDQIGCPECNALIRDLNERLALEGKQNTQQ